MANILIIDDDKEIRDLLSIILTGEKHNVITASDGQDGFHIYKTQKLDLIITDIIMPNKDGIDLIIDIVNSGNSVPIIAMSGGKRTVDPSFHPELYASSEGILKSLACQLSEFNLNAAGSLGIKDTLKKPFTAVDLLKAVNRALSSSNG